MYEKLVSVIFPVLVQFILDDSGSMDELLPGTTDRKYLWVERYFGLIIQELLNRSTAIRNGTSIIKPRYYLNVIIYGSEPRLWGREMMRIDEAVNTFATAGNSLGLGGKLGGTDAKSAVEMGVEVLKRALAGELFKQSFPSISLHLTDSASQSDPTGAAQNLMQLSTDDGQALFANAFIGTQTNLNYSGPDDFPGYLDADEAGPDADCLRMFHMSSRIPSSVHANLKADGVFPQLRDGARLFFDVRTKEMLRHVIQVVGSQGSRADR